MEPTDRATNSTEVKDSKKRVQITLSPSASSLLETLALKREMTTSQVVRQAIQTEDFLQNQIEEGGKIVIHRKDGTFREIVLR